MVRGDTDRARPAPTCLTATAGDGKVFLAWTASTSSDVMGYNVYSRLHQQITRPSSSGDLYGGRSHQRLPWPYLGHGRGQRGERIRRERQHRFARTPIPRRPHPRDFAPPAPPTQVTASADCTVPVQSSVAWNATRGHRRDLLLD